MELGRRVMPRRWPLFCLLMIGVACLFVCIWVLRSPGTWPVDWSAPRAGEALLRSVVLALLSVFLIGYGLYGLLRPTPLLELTAQGLNISAIGGYAGIGAWRHVAWSQVRNVRIVSVRARTHLGVIPIRLPAMPYLAIDLADATRWEAEARLNGFSRLAWQRQRAKVGADLSLPLLVIAMPRDELLALIRHYRFDVRHGWTDQQVQAWDTPGA